jgi:two-component system sensor histidine kinase BaeS
MPEHPERGARPLDGVASITVKIGLLVALSILVAVVVLQVGTRAGVPGWLTLPVTLAAALGVTQWLARGMTSPLREMTRAAGRMATGDYSARVAETSADEVGRLARAFNTMAGDLGTADQQRRQVVATVSHELRTPLAAQRALLENLVDGVVTPDDDALQTALRQSERLSALVADLLDVSRVDGGAVPLDLAPVTVAELVDQAVAEVTVAGRSGAVRLETSVEPADLVVRADAARLQQVVANLLDNAVRHSPSDGVVRVRAAAEDDGRWSLEVTDEGPGIPAGQAQQVFTRFGVGDDSSGGTGLGLAIASWACQLHGGSIAALPPAAGGHGARVRALLPVHPELPGRDPDRTSQSPLPRPDRAAAMPVYGRTSDAGPGEHATPAAPPPVPSSMDALFGDLWPERGLRTAPLPLYASLTIGALAAAVLPYRNLGLGALLVLLASGGLVLTLSVHRGRRWTMLAAALCLGLASLFVLRAAEWLAVLALLAALVLVTTSLTGARRVLPIVAGGAAWLLSGLRGLPLLGRTLSATRRQRMVWPVLRTAAISLVALVVFGGLFASGDAVFGSWVSRVLPDLQLADSLVLRTFVWFVVGGVVLAACYLALNPPRVEKVALPPGRPVAHAWEWLVPVGVVLAVFLTFLVAQASAMWGGHDFVRRTTGMSYADYVHQGFAQLTVATALTLATIALAVRKAPRATDRDRRLLRGMLGSLCLLTLVVVASALFRMAVYQEAYGFTVLRVLVDAFEVWLGVLVVLVMVAGVRLSGWWLPRAALATGAALLLAIGWVNPEAWVAQQNIERFGSTGRLDLDYLSTLGADATPVIQEGLPPDLARCVVSGQTAPQATDDWLGWNLGRVRAAEVPGWANPSVTGEDCPAQIGE